MLVLTRKLGEKLVIGNDIVVTVVKVQGNQIRLSIDAPNDVRILRGELADWMAPLEKDAAEVSAR